VLVGLLFSAGVYPLIGSLLHPADSDTGDTMMLSLYVALGIFLLIAVRNPSAHRSLIAFAAWSSFAHAVAMSTLGLEIASQRVGFLVGSAVLVVIGVVLIALLRRNRQWSEPPLWRRRTCTLGDPTMKKVKSRKAISGRNRKSVPKNVDEYFARVSEPALSMLNEMRTAIRSALPPAATETISYGMPAFRHQESRVGLLWQKQ
jgi:hypothetical protein